MIDEVGTGCDNEGYDQQTVARYADRARVGMASLTREKGADNESCSNL